MFMHCFVYSFCMLLDNAGELRCPLWGGGSQERSSSHTSQIQKETCATSLVDGHSPFPPAVIFHGALVSSELSKDKFTSRTKYFYELPDERV